MEGDRGSREASLFCSVSVAAGLSSGTCGCSRLASPPQRVATCERPEETSDAAEETRGETTWEASTPPSLGVAGVPSTRVWISCTVLVRSVREDAQLPATRRGALGAGASGFIEPDEVLGVPADGGV